MKKILYILAAATLMMIACTKLDSPKENQVDVKPAPELVKMSFSATSAFTRAHLESDRSVTFSAGDKIAIFANGTKYEFTTTEGGASAVFEGSAETAETYYALFPYSDGAGFDTSTGTITGVNLAKTSTIGTPGSFQSQKPIFVAKATGNHLEFKSAVALLKITVPASVTDLKELYIFNRNSDLTGALTGTADITPTDGAPSVTITAKNDSPHTVGLSAPSGKTLKEGDYYLPIFPVTLPQGFDMKLNYSDSSVGRNGNGSELSFVAGQVYNLGSIYKMAGFIYSSFESGTLTDAITGGNEGSVSVVSNPSKDGVNGSNYVLKLDMSSRTLNSATSGLVKFNPVSSVKFPTNTTFRGFFNGVSIKFYSTDVYCPYFIVSHKETYSKPSRVNGVAVTDEESFNSAFHAGEWNLLEWDRADLKDVSSFANTCSSLDFRFFVDYNYNSLSRPDKGLICYIDDLSFFI